MKNKTQKEIVSSKKSIYLALFSFLYSSFLILFSLLHFLPFLSTIDQNNSVNFHHASSEVVHNIASLEVLGRRDSIYNTHFLDLQYLADNFRVHKTDKPSLYVHKYDQNLESYKNKKLPFRLHLANKIEPADNHLSYTRSLTAQQKRVALVMGNSEYLQVPSLINPQNDSYMVSEALRRLDFEVLHVTDVTRLGMEQAIRQFISLIKPDSVALFYFAGHGVQVTGSHFLIPVDARLSVPGNIEYDVINLKTIIQEMDLSPSKLNLLIVDACRDNPWRDIIFPEQLSRRYKFELKEKETEQKYSQWARTRNIQTAKGTLIAFATAENQIAIDGTGIHSPYTESLLKWIEKPNIEIGQMFREVRSEVQQKTNGQQMPWENGSITGSFYFNPQEVATQKQPDALILTKPPSDIALQQQIQSQEAQSKQEEELKWQAVQRIQNADILAQGLEQYLKDYPEGQYVDLARLQLLDLKKKAETPDLAPITEQKPEGIQPVTDGEPEHPSADKTIASPLMLSKFEKRLDQETRLQIQESLAALGLYRGLITGDFGPQTHGAILAFQKSKNYEPTGFLTPSEMILLFADAATKLRDNPEKEKELRKEKGPTWYVAATPEGKLAYVYGMLGDPEKTKIDGQESDGKEPTTTDDGSIALLTSAQQANGEQAVIRELMARPDLHSWSVKPPPAPAPPSTLSYRVVLNSVVFSKPARYEKEVGYVLPGTWVHVTGQVLNQNWFQIRSPNGTLGYVETYALSPKPHLVHSYSIEKENPNTLKKIAE